MGQGYSLTTLSAGSAGIDVPELRDLVYEKSIGSARFMKSIRARHHDGVVLVKVLVKPYTPMSLGPFRDKIMRERRIVADIPNALGYQRIVETETNGYLVRQFLYNSLYDRMSTRPFLEDIEKKWLAFQLLCAVRDCHARNVYHGDIKTENVLVTSWNWLYLTDFSAAFKPVLLPDDNPADFSYFFDTSGRRTCYLAPERFVPAAVAAEAAAAVAAGGDAEEEGEEDEEDEVADDSAESGNDEQQRRRRRQRQRRRRSRSASASTSMPAPGPAPKRITWAMDVFSVGCVLAELVLETPIFSLSQLFRYRRGEYDPVISHLSRIPDRDLADMIGHMIQLEPQKRYAAGEYLELYRGKVFPDYFYSFLHQYMEVVTEPTSGLSPVSGASRNLGEADERIDRVYYDFDKIAYFLGFPDSDGTDGEGVKGAEHGGEKEDKGVKGAEHGGEKEDKGVKSAEHGGTKKDNRLAIVAQAISRRPPPPRLGLDLFPVRLSIPTQEHAVRAGARATADDGALIFLTLIVASIRNTARAASKIRACDVLLAFAERLTDEARLDRVLPYLMALLTDRSDMVVAAAVRSITQLLTLVRTVSPVNAHVFLEYILPRMQVAILGGGGGGGGGGHRETSSLVRATYAACLGTLAKTANQFLDMAARVDRIFGGADEGKTGAAEAGDEAGADLIGAGAGGGGMGQDDDVAGGFDSLFDAAQRDLVDMFEQHTKALIEDADPYVRRAFLTSVPELCLFFGAAGANDIIVTHLNTYLNDRDWMLRCAFFDTMVGVATFLGSVSLEEFFLPLMMQALTDPEEHVVQAVLQALAELAGIGLFSKQRIWEIVEVVARFTMHPNIWIREAAARFLSAATKFLSPAQIRCLFLPLVSPYLKPGMALLPRYTELDFLDHLQKPLTRPVFEQALTWAAKTDRGVFWKPVQRLRGFPFGMASGSSGGSGPGGFGSAESAESGSGSGPLVRQGRETMPRLLSKVPRKDEDDQWISRLRNLGMSTEDEFKLLALREYLWRLSQVKIHYAPALAAAAAAASSADGGSGGEKRSAINSTTSNTTTNNTLQQGGLLTGPPNLNNIIPLRSLGVSLQTVLFDEEPPKPAVPPTSASSALSPPPPLVGASASASAAGPDGHAPRSIEDALHDASMSIDDPIAKRRRAALNIHKSRRLGGSTGRGAGRSASPAVLRDSDAGSVIASSPSEDGFSSRPSTPRVTAWAGGAGAGAGTGESPKSDELSAGAKRGAMLRHRPSAISLLNRKDSVKSGAETATTEANAFGQVEGRSVLASDVAVRTSPPTPSEDLDNAASVDGGGGGGGGMDNKYRAHHSYAGNDPSVLKMLDAMFVENYPHDLADFSPVVTPISRRKAAAGGGGGGSSSNSSSSSSSYRRGGGGGGGSGSNGSGHGDAWRPTGQMVATFSEHTGAINRVVVAPDHAFFITGGDDGTVRIWDTQRLERNISHRSRQTYRHGGSGAAGGGSSRHGNGSAGGSGSGIGAPGLATSSGSGVRVLALCFVENTHCFVSCANDGSVHVVKVEYVAITGGMPRYNRLRLLREYQLPAQEWAVWCEHYKQDAHSVLVLATNRSRLLGIDLRTMAPLFTLHNPVQHGTPTCFAIDRKHNWLVVSTSHGVLDLWDLRFKMRLKGWGIGGGGGTNSSSSGSGGNSGSSGGSPIYRLAIHPSKGRGKWLCVAGGTGQGEVTVWDLEKTLCREVYRVGGGIATTAAAATAGVGMAMAGVGSRDALLKKYEPWDVDGDKPEGMLRRFATSIDPAAASSPGSSFGVGGGGGGGGSGDKGVRAMVVGSPWVDEQRDARHSYIITGGSDKKLRFWDLSRIENSVVYSGLMPDEPRPTFGTIQVTTALTVNMERVLSRGGASSSSGGVVGTDGKTTAATPTMATTLAMARAGTTAATKKGAAGLLLKGRSGGGGNPGSGSSGSSSTPRPSRSAMIAMQQQQLLRSHLDAIMDAAQLEIPYTATVSVDRMGVIFVFS